VGSISPWQSNPRGFFMPYFTDLFVTGNKTALFHRE
jgi:hypothetical protein